MTARRDQTLIHMGRRRLGLEDDDYRALLERVTGQRSSKDLTPAQARSVVAELKRLGFRPKAGRRRSRSPHPHVRKVYKLWWELAGAGAVGAGHRALNAFIGSANFRAKWGEVPTDAEFLTVERASDVIEALKDIARRKAVQLPA